MRPPEARIRPPPQRGDGDLSSGQSSAHADLRYVGECRPHSGQEIEPAPPRPCEALRPLQTPSARPNPMHCSQGCRPRGPHASNISWAHPPGGLSKPGWGQPSPHAFRMAVAVVARRMHDPQRNLMTTHGGLPSAARQRVVSPLPLPSHRSRSEAKLGERPIGITHPFPALNRRCTPHCGPPPVTVCVAL
jgi:hypothetical protein